MAVALPFGRSGFLEQAATAVPVELRRACPAVMLPAGSRRSGPELPSARFYVVEDGVVLLRSFAHDGTRSMVSARCASGAILSPPGGDEYLHSLTDAWLTAVPAAVWRRLVAVPEVADLVVSGLEETLARQRQATRAMAGIRNTDRVRAQLLELALEHGRVCRDGVRIDLPITHDLIADMVGCARETVTRAFEELQREGLVERRNGGYQLRVRPESLYA